MLSQFSFVRRLWLVVLFASSPLLAIEVDNLYQGKVLVQDRTQKSRISAHKRAISQVFSKVTGDKSVLQIPRIQSIINYRAANYIKSFSYVTDELDRTFLVDEFDQKRIDELLKSAGASIWGKRRPQTLIWLVKEEGFNRNFINQQYEPQLYDFITQSASDRGLPILIPSEQQYTKVGIFTSDIWGRFFSSIRSASETFNADNILVARMRYIDAEQAEQGTSGWLLEYQLIDNQTVLFEQSIIENQFDALRNMIDELGQYYASQYAVDSQQLKSDTLFLTIHNYQNIISLNKAEQLLLSISAVEQVYLSEVTKQQALFELKLTGEPLDVVRSLELLEEFEQIVQPTTPKVKRTNILSIEEQLALLETNKKPSASLWLGEQPVKPEPEVAKLSYKWRGN